MIEPMHRAVVVLVAAILVTPLHADPKRKPAIDVSGRYDSNYDEVTLHQSGTIVEGDYVCCGGGRIEGKLRGRVIRYHWEGNDGTEGNGVWTVTGIGSLRGTWGWDASEDDGGEWNLDRVRESAIAN